MEAMSDSYGDALIGQGIRRARQRAGLTQAELATIMGRHRSTILEWENGYHRVGDDDLVKLAAALEVTPGYLWRGGRDETAGPRIVKGE